MLTKITSIGQQVWNTAGTRIDRAVNNTCQKIFTFTWYLCKEPSLLKLPAYALVWAFSASGTYVQTRQAFSYDGFLSKTSLLTSAFGMGYLTFLTTKKLITVWRDTHRRLKAIASEIHEEEAPDFQRKIRPGTQIMYRHPRSFK